MRRILVPLILILFSPAGLFAKVTLRYQWFTRHLNLSYSDDFDTLWIDGNRSSAVSERLYCLKNVLEYHLIAADVQDKLYIQVSPSSARSPVPGGSRSLSLREISLKGLEKPVNGIYGRKIMDSRSGRDYYGPLFSNSGESYVYREFYSDEFSLYMKGVSGTVRLIAEKEPVKQLRWSPDDENISYVIGGNLWRLDLRKRSNVCMTGQDHAVRDHCWFPDGKSMLLLEVSRYTDEHRFVAEDIQTGKRKVIPVQGAFSPGQMMVSEDGSYAAVVTAAPAPPDVAVYVLDLVSSRIYLSRIRSKAIILLRCSGKRILFYDPLEKAVFSSSLKGRKKKEFKVSRTLNSRLYPNGKYNLYQLGSGMAASPMNFSGNPASGSSVFDPERGIWGFTRRSGVSFIFFDTREEEKFRNLALFRGRYGGRWPGLYVMPYTPSGEEKVRRMLERDHTTHLDWDPGSGKVIYSLHGDDGLRRINSFPVTEFSKYDRQDRLMHIKVIMAIIIALLLAAGFRMSARMYKER